MKDNQEFGQLLNTRQKLFGVPVTSFEPLLKLIKEFTPYKDLWLTASGKFNGRENIKKRRMFLNKTIPDFRLVEIL